MTLHDFFSEHRRAVLAFSGGTDSAYLLYAALKCKAQIYPVFVHTVFQPEWELCDAKRLAMQLSCPLKVADVDILADADIVSNPADRCYRCKSRIMQAVRSIAQKYNCPLIIDGTNASDIADDRPGMRALTEYGVRSPLRECGIDKARVRELSRQAGLFTWNKDAYACLATRVPCGEELTEQLLSRIEAGENALFDMGFHDFRVRTLHGAARLQFRADELPRAFSLRQQIYTALAPYFDTILLDIGVQR